MELMREKSLVTLIKWWENGSLCQNHVVTLHTVDEAERARKRRRISLHKFVSMQQQQQTEQEGLNLFSPSFPFWVSIQ